MKKIKKKIKKLKKKRFCFSLGNRLVELLLRRVWLAHKKGAVKTSHFKKLKKNQIK